MTGRHCMNSGTLLEISVCEHSSLCNSLMQVQAGSYKEEAIYEHSPEHLLSSLDQSSSQMVKGEMVLNYPAAVRTFHKEKTLWAS